MAFSRREFLKIAGASAAALSFGGVLSACSNGGSSAGPSDTNGVVVAMTRESEPEAGFDPFYSWGCGEHVHEPLLQSTLVTTDTDLNFKNDLATAYSCSSDGLTWSFDIRDDVKFSDGQPLTAQDVAFTINGIKSFEGSELDLSYVDKATATSATHVDIMLNKPFNALLYTLAVVGIVPEHAYDATSYGANPIGSGRYVLEQWDKGQQVIFKANPDYYGEAPKMERLTVLFMDEDAALAAVQSGSVDIAYTTATLADQSPKGYELLSCATVDCRGISLPTVAPGAEKTGTDGAFPAGNALTCHEEVRKAINCAIDRERLVDNVLNGHGTVAYSVCDALPWGSEDMKVATDLEAAAKFMTDAGWEKGADGIYAKGGERASLELFYASSDSVRQAIANEFMNQMGEFGIEVKVTGSSWTTDASGLYAHQYSDPIVWGWGANSPTQLRLLREQGGRCAPGRGACQDEGRGLVRRVEEGPVGWRAGRGTAGRRVMGLARERRPPLLQALGTERGGAEAASSRARLVARQQRRPVDVVGWELVFQTVRSGLLGKGIWHRSSAKICSSSSCSCSP